MSISMKECIFASRSRGALSALSICLGVFAASSVTSAEDVTEQVANDASRYSIAEVDGDLLRVDRETGAVTVCESRQDLWRCMPVPQAEQAYIAEIDHLTTKLESAKLEIERLNAALAASERQNSDENMQESADEPLENPDRDSADNDNVSEPVAPNTSPRLTEEDEKHLDEFLDFSQKAMKRFFGFVKELQKDLTTANEG